MLRTFGYTFLGGVIFFVAGMLVYKRGVAAQLEQAHFFVSALAAVLILGIYTLCGWVTGFILALSGAILRKVTDWESRVQNFLAPRITKLLAKIPVGQEGLAIAEFKKLWAGESLQPATIEEQTSPALFSSFKFASRFLLKRVLQATQRVFMNDFLEQLQARGQTRVHVNAVEQFGREKLVALVLDYLRAPVSLARLLTMIIAAILLLLPLLTFFSSS